MAKMKLKSGFNFDRGEHTTVTASDTVATGLADVKFVYVTLNSDPIAGASKATAVRAGAAGFIVIKTWKPTAVADTTPIAATTFGRSVSWFAVGS